MKSFHDDPKIKQKYLDRVRQHRIADEIIKGTYWKKGKGCAVGCTVHSKSHRAYEIELGIPMILAKLEDAIFENLPNKLAMTWPERFLESIPIGADLSLIWPKYALWTLMDSKWGVFQYAKSDKTKIAIQTIADLYKEHISEEKIDRGKWRVAAAAAYVATDADATTTAYAYATAYAAAYAYAAAAAAVTTAPSAVYDAVYVAAYDAAYDKIRVAQSEKLLELLKSIC